MTTRIAMACSFVLLAGCSFIDDWSVFTTQPAPTEDAGTDAQVCVDSCTPGGADCEGLGVCVLGTDGCFACAACDGCDPSTCPTVCELVPDTTQCTCAPLQGEGGSCADSAQCESPLLCAGVGACLYQCGTDADCTGLYARCVDSFCYVPAVETVCTDFVDEDADGNTDCADVDCAGDPACSGKAGEWDACPSGSCAAGLECRNGLCLRNCATATECAGDFPECADFNADGVAECTPVLGCDFVYDAGCETGFNCRLLFLDGTNPTLAGCTRPRTAWATVGAACSAEMQCEPRAECFVDGTGAGACYLWCYQDDAVPCPGTDVCSALGDPTPTYLGRPIGVCAPPTP